MTSVAERTRRKKAASARRSLDAAISKGPKVAGIADAGEARTLAPKKAYVRRETGLALLGGRGKIDAKQLRAGERYHSAFAQVELAACSPIRSNLAEPERAGGSATGGLPAAADFLSEREILAARTELQAARESVRLPYLVHALDVICGKQWTPGMVSAVQREQEETMRLPK